MKTIGIAGTQPHIGTTTQALQLVQYLQLMGNHAVYIEMNDEGYIKKMEDIFDELSIPEQGHIQFNHMDLFEQQHIRTMGKKGDDIDYIIKDYGSVTKESFNRASFLEQDMRIFVGGVKANEIFFVYEILKQTAFDDASIILSFVDSDTDLRKSIKEMFDYTDGKQKYVRSDKVFFANYVPELFEYTGISNKMYSDLLNGGK